MLLLDNKEYGPMAGPYIPDQLDMRQGAYREGARQALAPDLPLQLVRMGARQRPVRHPTSPPLHDTRGISEGVQPQLCESHRVWLEAMRPSMDFVSSPDSRLTEE